MLEGVLEKYLLTYLAPYVDGISKDNLVAGVWSGKIELKNLSLKPDALALLGMPAYRAPNSSIKLIRIEVPWKALLKKTITVIVEGVHMQVEHVGGSSQPDQERIEQMKNSKRKVVELRTEQLMDILSQQQEERDASEGGGNQSYAASLARTFLENLHLNFSDLSAALVSKVAGLACSAELPGLSVDAAEEQFRSEVLQGKPEPNNSLFKVLRMSQLSLKMAPAGSSDLSQAGHLMTPISIDLNLGHVPSMQKLQLRLEVAAKKEVHLKMARSQYKHLMGVMAEYNAEHQRLYQLMAPPEDELEVMGLDGGKSSQEQYEKLFRRCELIRRNIGHEMAAGEAAKPLDDTEKAKLEQLEDVLPVLFLARQRLKVTKEIDVLEAEVQRRKSEQEKAAKAKRPGFFGRLMGRGGGDDEASKSEEATWLTKEDQEKLMSEVRENSTLEEIEFPSEYLVQLVLGTTNVIMIDDQWAEGNAQRECLSLALQGGLLDLDVKMKADFRGNDSAEWKLNGRLLPLTASQNGSDLIKVRGESSGSRSFVANFAINSLLEAKRNLMELKFDTMPLELNCQPGFYEKILEFVRRPELKNAAAAAAIQKQADMYDVWLDLTKQAAAAYGDSAKQAAAQVYERLPDAVALDIRIASPIFQVPVHGLGRSTISLGNFKLATSEGGCAYSDIGISMLLADMVVSATSKKGERYDIIQPTALTLGLTYSSAKSNVDIKVDMGEIYLTLAPQACRILLMTPFVFASGPETAPGADAVASATSGAATSASPGSPTSPGSHQPQAVHRQEASMMDTAQEIFQELADSSGAVSEAWEKAVANFEAAKATTFSADVHVAARLFNITLSDSVVPLWRVRAEMGDSGLGVKFVSVPRFVEVKVPRAGVELEILNPRHGAWEPVLEHFELSASYTMKRGKDNISDSEISISGYEPLLLDVSPSVIRMATWYVPFFLDGFRLPTASEGSSEEPQGHGVDEGCQRVAKYRVVNLSQEDIELTFISTYSFGGSPKVTIPPTGSEWRSLDEYILPTFADSLVARLGSGGTPSTPLSLERGVGVIEVPASNGLLAQLMTPHPSHQLLVLGSSLHVHNETDLPIVLRFHKQQTAAAHNFSDAKSKALMQCDAALFGHSPPSCEAESSWTQSASVEGLEDDASCMVLPPNGWCAVPTAVCAGPTPGTFVSFRPALSAIGFCKPFEILASSDGRSSAGAPEFRSCMRSNGSSVTFVCDRSAEIAAAPARVPMATLIVRPTLTLMNALPFGEIFVEVGPQQPQQPREEVSVSALKRRNLYLPCSSGTSGADSFPVRAKLSQAGVWSEQVGVKMNDLWRAKGVSEVVYQQELELSSHPTGAAAAGVNLVLVGRFAIRFEAPVWISDRTNLPSNCRLEIRHQRQKLPSQAGITLLPARCVEEESQLNLCNEGGDILASTSFRAPAGWSMLTLKTRERHYQFCLNSVSVAAADVMGASCQVATLRSRLIVTNLAEVPIEIRSGGPEASMRGSAGTMTLEVGDSTEWHFPSKGDGLEDEAILQFRAKGSYSWSNNIVCTDSMVGTSPFSIQGDIWTADVASVCGSWAISFRQGADYVVLNKAVRAKVKMQVNSEQGCPAVVVCPGEEKPYGWLHQNKSRAVTVTLMSADGSTYRTQRIANVQHTNHMSFGSLGVLLSCTRWRDKLVLQLEDHGAFDKGQADGAECEGSRLKVKLALGKMGLSLVQEQPQRELLYMQLQLIRAEFTQTEADIQAFKAVVSEGQIDCQLAGRVDGRTRNKKLAESQKLGLVEDEKPAVLFANCAAEGSTPFLTCNMTRTSTSSRDLVIPVAKLQVDAMDITVDDEWLLQFRSFLAQARSMSGLQQLRHSGGDGVSVQYLRDTSGESILTDYKVPPIPSVIQIEKLTISSLELTVWCKLALSSINGLSPQLRTLIQVLSFKRTLELDGATIKLPERIVPTHRGSVGDFCWSLGDAYLNSLLGQALHVLGKSSLLTVPLAPVKLGGVGVNLIGGTLSAGVSEIPGLLDYITLDKDYVKRAQEIRAQKKISGIFEGFVEAGSSLSNGLGGVTDIFTKSIEGGKTGGFGGFATGFGTSLFSAPTRLASGVVGAVSDLGRGVTAQVTQFTGTDTVQMRRNQARVRTRLPRLLYSDTGMVQPYSDFDAEVLRQVGFLASFGVEAVVPLGSSDAREGKPPDTRKVLLLFPERLIQTELRLGDSNKEGSFEPPTRSMISHLNQGFDLLTSTGSAVGAVFTGSSAVGQGALEPGDPEVIKKIQRFEFNEILKVEAPTTGELRFTTKSGGARVISLQQAGLGAAARKQLVKTFQEVAAADSTGRADWGPLRRELCKPEAFAEVSPSNSAAPSSSSHSTTHRSTVTLNRPAGGERILEVFEVEAKFILTQSWDTPSLPTDYEVSWRWTDKTGVKHPNLQKGLSKSEVIKQKVPPCDLDMYQPTTPWEIEKSSKTDQDGWMYAVNWRSTTWNPSPGLFDAVRKRRWTRRYS